MKGPSQTGKGPSKGAEGFKAKGKRGTEPRRDSSRQKARGKRGPSKRAEGVQGKRNKGKEPPRAEGSRQKGKRGSDGIQGKREKGTQQEPTFKKAKGDRGKGTAKGRRDSRQKDPLTEGERGSRANGQGQPSKSKSEKIG